MQKIVDRKLRDLLHGCEENLIIRSQMVNVHVSISVVYYKLLHKQTYSINFTVIVNVGMRVVIAVRVVMHLNKVVHLVTMAVKRTVLARDVKKVSMLGISEPFLKVTVVMQLQAEVQEVIDVLLRKLNLVLDKVYAQIMVRMDFIQVVNPLVLEVIEGN